MCIDDDINGVGGGDVVVGIVNVVLMVMVVVIVSDKLG